MLRPQRGSHLLLLSRREALATMSGALCAAAAPRWARAAAGPLGANDLGSGLVAISGAGANVVALRGSDGLLLVDGGSPQRSSDLLHALRGARGARPHPTLFKKQSR